MVRDLRQQGVTPQDARLQELDRQAAGSLGDPRVWLDLHNRSTPTEGDGTQPQRSNPTINGQPAYLNPDEGIPVVNGRVAFRDAIKAEPTAIGTKIADTVANSHTAGDPLMNWNDRSWPPAGVKGYDRNCLAAIDNGLAATGHPNPFSGAHGRRAGTASENRQWLERELASGKEIPGYTQVTGVTGLPIEELNKLPVGTIAFLGNHVSVLEERTDKNGKTERLWVADVAFDKASPYGHTKVPPGTVVLIPHGKNDTLGTPTANGSDVYNAVANGQIPGPEVGQRGDMVALAKTRLQYIEKEFPEIAAVTQFGKGDTSSTYTKEAEAAMKRLHEYFGVSVPPGESALGPSGINLMNALIQQVHSKPQQFPASDDARSRVADWIARGKTGLARETSSTGQSVPSQE